MKCAYEAANGVEAHMIANMLEQHGIDTRIDGEHLASGVGELPAAGLVRVMVNEDRHDRAREIIREWEVQSPEDSTVVPQRRSFGSLWFITGLVAGVAIITWVNRPQGSNAGIDFDGDGSLDDRYTFSGDFLSKVETDANLDGRIDGVYNYERRGIPTSAELDLDFDGRFETKQVFERGMISRSETDLGLNGRVDRRESYTSGTLREVVFYDADGYTVVKREHYELGQLVSAEVDTNHDGVLETVRYYDRHGEIVDGNVTGAR